MCEENYYDNLTHSLSGGGGCKNEEQILVLLDQMIEKAEQDDIRDKERAYKEGDIDQTVGESWMIFHLKALKELIEYDERT